MPDLISLNERISSKAELFADAITLAAAKAKNEEEIKIAVERTLALLQKDLGIDLQPQHEFTVASGRVNLYHSRTCTGFGVRK